MIRIRYRDFSAAADGVTWLYGRAERSGAGTVIYLLPGLTAVQRRAVIRRLRQEASRGLGPSLPSVQLRLAIAVDRVRATFGIAVAVIRLHPVAALLPGACAAALAALFVLATAAAPGGPGGSEADSRSGAGPDLRPRTIVSVPAASRAAVWYVRSRGPAVSGPPLFFDQALAFDSPLTCGQPRRCSKPRTAP